MITIPKGKPVHKELSSSFVDLEKLIAELGANGFSGMVELMGVHQEGAILLEAGVVTNLRLRGDTTLLGKQQLPALLTAVRKENILISTYALPPESVFFLSAFFHADRVYGNLPSDFTDPKKLITKFEQEPGEYCLEAIFQKNLGVGLIFIMEGHISEALLSLLEKDLTTGPSAVKEIIEGAHELGATFNVYKGSLSLATAEPAPFTEPEPVSAPQSSAVGSSLDGEEMEVLAGVLLGQFPLHSGIGEKKDVSFQVMVREACLALAEKHPFLDPFAAEFSYKDGRAEIKSSEPAESILSALGDLVGELARVAQEKKAPIRAEEYLHAVSEVLAGIGTPALAAIDLGPYLKSLE